jgi:hypothetical protein
MPLSFPFDHLLAFWCRRLRALGWGWAMAAALALASWAAWAQGIEMQSIEVTRQDGGLDLSFVVRPLLSKAVEDALQRGVPVYFVAQADVYKPRWYWRDERVARVRRAWRLSYQPLTSSWRVSFGALSQSFTSFDEALSVISRTSRWKIADAEQVPGGNHYYVEFSYRLDNSQLPRPMQLDLAAQAEWELSVERTIKVD